MNIRQSTQHLLRQAGLLEAAESVRFALQRFRCRTENTTFIKNHPDFPTPPLHLLYEIGGRIRLASYLAEGQQSSEFLSTRGKTILGNRPINVLDWGCGVACVVRHMPHLFPAGSKIFGSDYNVEMIAWAKDAIPRVAFSTNELLPPLPFPGGSLDWIYGLSVITHLGEDALHAWLQEFRRVLKPGGLLTLTTNGSGCENLFSPSERTSYENVGLVVRSGLNEGRKMFLAYHHPDYFRRVVSDTWEVLEFTAKGMPITGQDLWWLQKKV